MKYMRRIIQVAIALDYIEYLMKWYFGCAITEM